MPSNSSKPLQDTSILHVWPLVECPSPTLPSDLLLDTLFPVDWDDPLWEVDMPAHFKTRSGHILGVLKHFQDLRIQSELGEDAGFGAPRTIVAGYLAGLIEAEDFILPVEAIRE